MASIRKLEEEIARTKDPQLRKQLQELLDKRNRRWNETKQKGSNLYKELTKPSPPLSPPSKQEVRDGYKVEAFIFFFLAILFAVITILSRDNYKGADYSGWNAVSLFCFILFFLLTLLGIHSVLAAYGVYDKKTKK